MDTEIINKYIALSLAIKVFRQDKYKFADFKFGNLYQDKIDSCLDQLQKDFNELRRTMYTVHHLDVKYLGKQGNEVRYAVNKEVITYSPEDLRKMTELVMEEYLVGSKAIDIERKSRVWRE